eukprot:TRINITY_DN52132_c0_g1_i1.p1 TRINITY_DN52132_c0_g1~~TRINITY_DN52132_c0_g1_i1.p1  ORF type:complete len:201 (-),score=37.77 TRINITY_DN52132_c0_g1_i1:102-704(-)
MARRGSNESRSPESRSRRTKRDSGRRRRRDDDSSPEASRSRRNGRRRERSSTVDRFIDENELNESTAARLRATSREIRERVMEQGWNVIDNARNASAVVISRIRKHETENGIGGGGGGGGDRGGGGGGYRGGGGRSRSRSRGGGDNPGGASDFRAGDWYCEQCGGHNFAKREECFKCGTPKDGRRKQRKDSRERDRDRRR